ncbi:MAG: hemerythrin domain-containing protein [Deltaproteobacteria bacterium]|jgi:hypothetical protein|nr:hemerythrin domain-containing protein [Deltaproteobacteria bacterium]MBW2536212.1 hemerythrin domain-containing protein [Deltaproteobacteria bacterium]
MKQGDAPGRFDLYRKIHKGIRRAMFQVTERLGSTDYRNDDEVTARCAELEELLGFLARHGEHEDRFIHRPLEAKLPDLFKRFDEDHARHDDSMKELQTRCEELKGAPEQARPELGFALYFAVAEFVADFVRHVAWEERLINPELWELHSDQELMAIQGQILESQPPPERALGLRYMLPALDPTERAQLLGAVKAMSPPEAFGAVCDLAQSVLDEPSWTRLSSDLGLP